MTNEEAIQTIKSISQWEYWQNDTLEAFVLAIKALETGEVYMTGVDYNLYIEGYKDGKRDFEPKQGEWIQREELFDDEETSRLVWGCKDCGFSLKSIHDKRNYCPNCGAKMKDGAE